MKYVVKIDSGAMICIPSLIKTGSDIKKLMGGGYTNTQTYRLREDLISLLLFLEIRKVDLNINLREIRLDRVDWIDLAQDRNQWRAIVVMNLWVP
jgi:uncharacterized protein Smg (DUF494 family)